MEFYYEKKGQQIGPISKEELQTLVDNKELSRDTLIWCNTYKDWTPISNSEFNLQQLSPPPLTGLAINNTYLWVLAFMPILCWLVFKEFLIDYVTIELLRKYAESNYRKAVSFANSIDKHQAKAELIFAYIANTIVSVLDEKKLKSAGHNTEKLSGWIWVVPVYIYSRCKETKVNLAPLFVWIGALLLYVILTDETEN